jgi:hypothetical protein
MTILTGAYRMKSIGSFSKWIASGVAVAALFAATSAQAASGNARVHAVRGTATYSAQGGEWKTLLSGSVLGPGASIKTGVNSQVDLGLGVNGTRVVLLADTTLGLEKLNYEGTGVDVIIETLLDLTTGTIQGNVQQMAAASKYEVKTPQALFAIKGTETGTEYQITAAGKLDVIRGAVIAAYGQPPRTTTVNAGQTFAPPAQPTAQPTVRPTEPTEVPPSIPGEFGPPPSPTAPVTAPPPIQFVSPGSGKAASGS